MLRVLRNPGPLMGTFDLAINFPELAKDPGNALADVNLPLGGKISAPINIKRKDESVFIVTQTATITS